MKLEIIKEYYDSEKTRISSISRVWNNKLHGNREYYQSDGKKIAQERWRNGVLQGKSWMRLIYDQILIENYIDGKLNGKSIVKDEKGNILNTCYYIDDEPQRIILSDNNDILLVTAEMKPVSSGINIIYHNNGHIHFIKSYEKGSLHGNYLEFRDNGVIVRRENYINGKLEGEATIYYPNGKIRSKEIYSEGELVDTSFIYYNNGAIHNETVYASPNKKEYVKTYFKNGNIFGVSKYNSNQKLIDDIAYYQNGTIAYTFKYYKTIGNNNIYKATEFRIDGSIKNILTRTEYDYKFEKTHYGQNGEVLHINKYREGKILSGLYKEFYDNDVPKYEVNYHNGKEYGLTKEYYENGILSSEVNFTNDIRNGICKYYDLDGKLKSECIYSNNRIVEGSYKEYDQNGNIIINNNT